MSGCGHGHKLPENGFLKIFDSSFQCLLHSGVKADQKAKVGGFHNIVPT